MRYLISTCINRQKELASCVINNIYYLHIKIDICEHAINAIYVINSVFFSKTDYNWPAICDSDAITTLIVWNSPIKFFSLSASFGKKTKYTFLSYVHSLIKMTCSKNIAICLIWFRYLYAWNKTKVRKASTDGRI
jgi:hypothetical protein